MLTGSTLNQIRTSTVPSSYQEAMRVSLFFVKKLFFLSIMASLVLILSTHLIGCCRYERSTSSERIGLQAAAYSRSRPGMNRPWLNDPALSSLQLSRPVKRKRSADSEAAANFKQPKATQQAQEQRLSGEPLEECSNPMCTGFLQTTDRWLFESCARKAESLLNLTRTAIKAEDNEAKCRFLKGNGRGAVALTSFPGSGNTWVRGLLQSVTGICTGGYYCDVSLRWNGFPGERISSGSTLVVKNHGKKPLWVDASFWDGATAKKVAETKAPVTSAILLVRNPLDAIVAEWNRMVTNGFESETVVLSSHQERAGIEWFRNNSDWVHFIHQKAIQWKNIIQEWLPVDNHPVLVVHYEDLKNDSFTEVKRMLDFLKFDYNDAELKEKLSEDYGKFHRKPRTSNIKYYLPIQKRYVRTVLAETLVMLKERNLSHLFHIQDYL